MSFAFRQKRKRPWLVLAPLVDILALLVFFFLVYGSLAPSANESMASLSAETQREVELALRVRVEQNALYIAEAKAMSLNEGRFHQKSILPSGRVHPLTNMMRSLHKEVQHRFRNAPVREAIVSIQVAPKIPFGTLSRLVRSLKEAGFKRFRYEVASAR